MKWSDIDDRKPSEIKGDDGAWEVVTDPDFCDVEEFNEGDPEIRVITPKSFQKSK